MRNIKGYDISPDMVRIGLANMYLHGFPDPSVEEYDTLSSDERWNEYYNIFLANPPFMTPKEGMVVHSKFRKGQKFDRKRYNYLLLNYEKFQQGHTEERFQDLNENNLKDLIKKYYL